MTMPGAAGTETSAQTRIDPEPYFCLAKGRAHSAGRYIADHLVTQEVMRLFHLTALGSDVTSIG